MIRWDVISQAFPAFMTIMIIPFTYSIANGVVASLFFHFMLAAGRKVINWRGGGTDDANNP
jgi:adenine/guanine/hypoxanthine permease